MLRPALRPLCSIVRRCSGGLVKTETLERVRLIGLNRPEKRNSVNNAMARQLLAAFRAFDADDSVGKRSRGVVKLASRRWALVCQTRRCCTGRVEVSARATTWRRWRPPTTPTELSSPLSPPTPTFDPSDPPDSSPPNPSSPQSTGTPYPCSRRPNSYSFHSGDRMIRYFTSQTCHKLQYLCLAFSVLIWGSSEVLIVVRQERV